MPAGTATSASTFAAITGRIVGALARGEDPGLDIAAYRPDRSFDGSHVMQRAA